MPKPTAGQVEAVVETLFESGNDHAAHVADSIIRSHGMTTEEAVQLVQAALMAAMPRRAPQRPLKSGAHPAEESGDGRTRR